MPVVIPLDDFSFRGKEALIRGVIWAFIGSLYGMVFKFFYSLAGYWSFPVSSVLIAGTLSACLAALIYSSMKLAVIVTMVSSIVSLIYVISAGEHINIVHLSLIGAIVGSLIGALYGLRVKASRVFRADAKILAGLSAGASVSILFVAISQALPTINLVLTISILCLLTGALYVAIVAWFIKQFDGLLPAVGNGAMVGAGTGIFVSILFFLMITAVTPEVAGGIRLLTEIIRYDFLKSAFGGMIGGGISGFISGWMLRDWQDL